MIKSPLILVIASSLLFSCATSQSKDVTIATLAKKTINLDEPKIQPLNRENTAGFYRRFLKDAPNSAMYGDAMRRLADLELQTGQDQGASSSRKKLRTSKNKIKTAIKLYETFLETYPNRKNNDLILYQLAKAYELDLQQEKLLPTLNKIIRFFPKTQYIEEVQFRRGEAYFVRNKYKQAELAYNSILQKFPDSSYYEKSLYKYAWTRFKQANYKDAAKSFVHFLDIKYKQGQLKKDGPSENVSRSEKELLSDILRATSLSFSYQQGHKSINQFFKGAGHKAFEPVIYDQLAKLYLSKDRIRDAAETYLAYSKTYPISSIAPEYHSRAIASYKKGGFTSLVLPAKITFVKQYGVNTPYWKAQNIEAQTNITPLLKKHTKELANHFHAKARKTKKVMRKKSKVSLKSRKKQFAQEITQATSWYKLYIKSFPKDKSTAKINFLLAEAHQDAGQYRNAIYQFEKTAYQYPESTTKPKAAYAALLLYPAIQKSLKGKKQKDWQQKKISSALKFTNKFPKNKRTPSILANTAEELFKMGDYPRAINTSTFLITSPKVNKKLQISALLVMGHSEFEMRQYLQAEEAYRALIKKLPAKHKEFKNIKERLAASIYKQGELAKSSNKLAIAAEFYLRVGKDVPSSKLKAVAEYDAATIYIGLKRWHDAEKILERFRKTQNKKHKLQFGVTEKLALVYTQTGRSLKAANEMIRLTNEGKHYTRNQRRELLWDAAKIYNDNKRTKTAKRILTAYIKNYPYPLEPAIEARQLLANFTKKSNTKRHHYWLREIIKADNKGGKARTARTQYLAATAYMELTLPLFKAYTRARLTIPLKRSLKKKKKLMQRVVKSYDNAMKYRVKEITTSATFYIAEIYNDFAGALLQSQRPTKLSADELDEYNVLIEEQAFPFEEKAIDIHTANAERVKDNIYDKWVKSSITALSKLNPIRFAKTEAGEAYAP
ncbi:MAG: tetratricopeptide repeat protein [Woeseiaceae bacterium]